MKLSATVSALIISALASSSSVEARNAGSRRSLQLNDNTGSSSSSNNLVKRVSLAQMKENSNMQKKVKRQPLANAAPIAAAAGFGSIPSMNDGNMPIIGLSKRQNSFDSHNGKQGTALTSSNTVTSSNNSGSSTTTSSDSTDADAEECEEDDGDDDEDCDEDDSADAEDEECEEDDSADDEECEEDDGEDDEEDCTEEDTDSSATTSSSSSDDTVAAATANANVNLKKVNNDSKASASSSSSKNNWGQTPSSSSAAASKTSSSAASKATESSSSSSADGDSFTGTATWYTQGGNAGACGTVNPDSARIIALYTSAYGNGDNCGRSVVIKNLDDGTQTTATVADMCPSCGGPEDIDLSVGAFEAIDPEYRTHGVRNIEWYFTD